MRGRGSGRDSRLFGDRDRSLGWRSGRGSGSGKQAVSWELHVAFTSQVFVLGECDSLDSFRFGLNDSTSWVLDTPLEMSTSHREKRFKAKITESGAVISFLTVEKNNTQSPDEWSVAVF